MCQSNKTPLERAIAALQEVPSWLASQPAAAMGDVVLQLRKAINMSEGISAEATRRFEKSGAYKTEGALGIVPWLRDKARLSGGSAAQHVDVARQLGKLPKTEEALARGAIGYEHAVAMAKTAEHVGATAVRKSETTLLNAAQTMDPGQFVTLAKSFEHEVAADSALGEANRAHERRYFHVSEPADGVVRLEGQVTTEAGAKIRTALEPYLKPGKNDERTSGQRAADALVEALCRSAAGFANGSGPRPQLIVKTTLDTLAGIAGAPAGLLEWGGTVPAETVRRLGCDAAITRITGLGELDHEITHSARTIPPATRRALAARDGHCVFPGCDRPAPWCEGHHLRFWADGGPTKLENLALVCAAHHRKVHEEGFRLGRREGRWITTPPPPNGARLQRSD